MRHQPSHDGVWQVEGLEHEDQGASRASTPEELPGLAYSPSMNFVPVKAPCSMGISIICSSTTTCTSWTTVVSWGR